MPGDVGLVAGLIQRLISLVVDEDQLPQMRKRWQLASKKEEARRALLDNRFDDAAAHIRELRDLSSKP